MLRVALLYSLLLLAGSCAPAAIQLFGDSTQAMAYPLLRERFDVSNSAVGETTSGMLIEGTNGIDRAWPYAVVSKVVVVNYGMNDAYPWEATPIAAYKANLRQFARGPGTVILETPNPSTVRNVAPYAQAMREVAAEFGLRVIDVHACFMQQPDWQSRLYDGVHPDERGMRHIVDVCVGPALREMSKAR